MDGMFIEELMDWRELARQRMETDNKS